MTHNINTDKPKPQHPLRSCRSGVRCLMMAAITESKPERKYYERRKEV